ncbi:hypothetical protein Tco_0221745 [Tanacetum coccineum]
MLYIFRCVKLGGVKLSFLCLGVVSTFLFLVFEEVLRLLLVGLLSSSEADSDGGVIGFGYLFVLSVATSANGFAVLAFFRTEFINFLLPFDGLLHFLELSDMHQRMLENLSVAGTAGVVTT